MDCLKMREALRECVKCLGRELLTEPVRFKAVLYDILPGYAYEQERSLLNIAVGNRELVQRILRAPEQAADRERLFGCLLRELADGGILTAKAAESVLQAFAYALDWPSSLLADPKGGVSAGGESVAAASAAGCAHHNIDYFSYRCSDCNAALCGLFTEDNYVPYEKLAKKERGSFLLSFGPCRGNLVLPEHINNISDNCFADNAQLQEVVFPEGLVSIGKFAFENCQSLKIAKIPDSVQSIGEFAFSGCSALHLKVPSSAKAEDEAFTGVKSLSFASSNTSKNAPLLVQSSFKDLSGLTPFQRNLRLAEQGDADAQYNVGKAYGDGNGAAQDYAEAVKWYRKAAEQGNADAQYKHWKCLFFW